MIMIMRLKTMDVVGKCYVVLANHYGTDLNVK